VISAQNTEPIRVIGKVFHSKSLGGMALPREKPHRIVALRMPALGIQGRRNGVIEKSEGNKTLVTGVSQNGRKLVTDASLTRFTVEDWRAT
jgi:hypothetical protein